MFFLSKTNKKLKEKKRKTTTKYIRFHICIYFNNKVTLAVNEQRKGDKESLTHDTPTSLVKTGIHEALKHIVCVNRGYNY